jgi:methionyl-tRNA synthetase
LRESFVRAEGDVQRHMEELHFHRALEAVWSAIDQSNRYIAQTAPFSLMKDAANRPRAGEVLHHALEALRAVAYLLTPFLPETAGEIGLLLNLPDDGAARRPAWGEGFPAAHRVKPPKALFPRIDLAAEK